MLEKSTESYRHPKLIFLSDGADEGIYGMIKHIFKMDPKIKATVEELAKKQQTREAKLSFHAVYFAGNGSTGEKIMNTMVETYKSYNLEAEFHMSQDFTQLRAVFDKLSRDNTTGTIY